MQTRRYKPFRKQPPMRRRAQLWRLQGARWESHDEEWEEEWEDGWEEGPELVRVPAPRVPVHDQDPEPEPAPLPLPYDDEPARGRRGRRVLAAGVVGVVVAALVVGALILTRGGSGSPTRPDQAPVAFRPPVSVPADGELVRTHVLPSGDLRVDHWIRSTASLSGVTVEMPDVAGIAPGSLSVRGLVAEADGLAQKESATLTGSDHRFTFPMSSTVHVRYVVRGATQHSGPGGRVLVRTTALDLGYYPAAKRRTLEVVGPTVLSLACSQPGGTPSPCGLERHGRWTVDLSGRPATEQVLAQVELGA